MNRSFQSKVAALRDALAILLLGFVVFRTWRDLSSGWLIIIVLATFCFLAVLVGQPGMSPVRQTLAWIRQNCLAATIHVGTRLSLALILSALLWSAGRLGQRLSPSGLWITYFNGAAFEQRVCNRAVRELCRDYGARSPALGVPADYFSARGDGILRVPATANYTFYSQSDDGLRLIIDGTTVIDAWRDQKWQASGTAGHMRLTAGDHSLRVEYYDRDGEGAWRIKWAGGPIPDNTVLGAPYLRKH